MDESYLASLGRARNKIKNIIWLTFRETEDTFGWKILSCHIGMPSRQERKYGPPVRVLLREHLTLLGFSPLIRANLDTSSVLGFWIV